MNDNQIDSNGIITGVSVVATITEKSLFTSLKPTIHSLPRISPAVFLHLSASALLIVVEHIFWILLCHYSERVIRVYKSRPIHYKICKSFFVMAMERSEAGSKGKGEARGPAKEMAAKRASGRCSGSEMSSGSHHAPITQVPGSSDRREVTRAIILVGGWGTRLRPLTYTVPKPLVPFCNKPMLRYQMDKLVHAGVREVVLAVNYYSDLIMAECEKYEEEYSIKIIYSKEDYPMGTGGPIALARDYLKGGPFFVMNSDICCNADLLEMKNRFKETDATGMIMTFPVSDPSRYGLVKTEEGGGDRIVSFEEKPSGHSTSDRGENARPCMINAGVYIFTEELFDYVSLREVSLEREVFPVLASKRELVYHRLEGYWMDIGQIQDYLLGQKMCLSNENLQACGEVVIKDTRQYRAMMLIPETNVVIGRDVSIGKGVVLENCAIFDGAVIGDNSVVKNSIVGWNCVVGDNCYIEDVSVLGKGVSVENNNSLRSARISSAEYMVQSEKNRLVE